MLVKDAARECGYTPLYLREWIAQCQEDGREHPFGSMVHFPGSSKRTFRINEAAFRKWLNGDNIKQEDNK